MRFSQLAFALLLTGCQSPPESGTAFQPLQSNIPKDPFKNIAYAGGGDPHHALDLYLPRDEKGEPLLIFIHGGAWIGGDKGLYARLGRRFADDGIAVANVNYRLSPYVQYPEHVKDAAQAYAWLVRNAAKYGYDPKKIFVSGHSAGAHSAAMMATGHFLTRANVPAADMPAGFLGFEGIYDLPNLNTKFPGYKDWFLSKAFGPENGWAEASPTRRQVRLQAPWLVAQSTTDPLVDVSQTDKFAAHLRKAGIKVEVWEKDMGGHDAVVQNLSDPQNELAGQILKFIRQP